MPPTPATVSLPPLSPAHPPSPATFNFTRSAFLNLLGEGIPALVSLLALRILVHRLHEERFAILTLAWTVMAYFSIVDLGIGRALTQSVARRLAAGDTQRAAALIYTGLIAIPLLGLAGTIALILLTPALVRWLLVPPALAGEARWTFTILALSLPMLITTAGLRAILEARARFGLLSIVKCTTGTLVLLVPLALLPFTTYTPAVVAAAVAVRALGTLLHAAACFADLRPILPRPRINRAAAAELFRFGRWLTLDNLITPALVYGDRWLLPRLTSFAAVAYYATPYDLTLRLLFIPFAVGSVLFPAFARDLANHNHATPATLDRGTRLLITVLFPVTLFIVALAPEAIALWLGPAWASQSGKVLQLSAVALFIGGMSVVPSALVQAAGRPDLTFAYHLVEIPIHLAILCLLAPKWGTHGAAAAFVTRVAIDFTALACTARWLLRKSPDAHLTFLHLTTATAAGAALLLLLTAVGSLHLRLALLAILLPAFLILAWTKFIHRQESAWLWARLRRMPPVPMEGG